MRKKPLLHGVLPFLLCVILLLPFAAIPAFAAPGGETLTVGVPAERCPIFYLDLDNGEITGIGVDLMLAAAEGADYALRFRTIEEQSLKDALDNPAYDLLMPFGSAISSSAGKASIVSDNLIQMPFTLVTEGRRNLPPMDELRVGMLKSLGAGAETVKQMFPGMEIMLYDTMPECVSALRSGKLDALLHNS